MDALLDSTSFWATVLIFILLAGKAWDIFLSSARDTKKKEKKK